MFMATATAASASLGARCSLPACEPLLLAASGSRQSWAIALTISHLLLLTLDYFLTIPPPAPSQHRSFTPHRSVWAVYTPRARPTTCRCSTLVAEQPLQVPAPAVEGLAPEHYVPVSQKLTYGAPQLVRSAPPSLDAPGAVCVPANLDMDTVVSIFPICLRLCLANEIERGIEQSRR